MNLTIEEAAIFDISTKFASRNEYDNRGLEEAANSLGAKPLEILENVTKLASRNKSDNGGSWKLLGGKAPENFRKM